MRPVPFVAVLLFSAPLFGRPKTDLVVLSNGDRLSCEIKKLQRGKVTVKTDASGTITVKWSHVRAVRSNYYFQLELESGIRHVGRLEMPEETDRIAVVDEAGTTIVEIPQVVELVPIEGSFFSRIKGSVDAGYDFTQANSATTWSASAELDYRVPKFETLIDFSSSIKTQTGAERIDRQLLTASLNRFFQSRWYAMILGQGEKSENQGLDFRGLVGAGVGRRLVQTNRSNIAVIGGGAFSREKYADQPDFDSNAELVVGIMLETFRFDSPELDLSSGFVVLPNLKTKGRYRLQVNGKAKIEIVRNLYWSLNVYESYDSDPPSDVSRRNDFGVTTSLGWSFK